MNITLIIGWVLSFGLVVFGIVFDTKKGINFGAMSNFIEIQSLAITVGGTIGCLVASFPMSYLKNLGKRIESRLNQKSTIPKSISNRLSSMRKWRVQKACWRWKKARTNAPIRL